MVFGKKNPFFGLISLYLLWSSPCSCEEKEEEK